MHRYLLHNDQVRDAGELFLSPGQVGLLNGWGVFSTIRVYDRVMFAWERHFARMRRDAALMRVPFPQDSAWLEERLYRLIDANKAFESTLRVAVVRNRGGMWEGPAVTRDFDLIAFTADVNNWGGGVKLGIVPNARYAANEFAGVKYLSWSPNLTWYERAHEQGLDEVILLNERGELSECTSANIFLAFGDEVRTPPLNSGCLPGVTRMLLLEEIHIDGARVVEKTLFPADLEQADEVFISSSTRELLPVLSVEGLKIRRGERVKNLLQAAFSDYIASYTAARKKTLTINVTR
ncbi:MAG TPA: aminotransferase class IV [Bryobacteraceae bacterium]|jgi:branched-chain amino acid aminotransferase|nr:aminotransferase class IV [Bryobacteraceae bacterium]